MICQPTTEVSPACLRFVAPAAAVGILGVADEVDDRLGGRVEALVFGHGVGLAEDDRGQAVRVHASALLVQGAAAGAELDLVDQEVQALAHGLLILAFFVRLAGAEERQQGHGGGGDAGFGHAARVAALAVAAGDFAQIEDPAAVGHLVRRQPFQGQGHGPFAAGAAAALADHRAAGAAAAAGKPGADIGADRGRHGVQRHLLRAEFAHFHGDGRRVQVVRGRGDHFGGIRHRIAHRVDVRLLREIDFLGRFVDLLDLFEWVVLRRGGDDLPIIFLVGDCGAEHGHHQKHDHVDDHAHEPTGRLADQVAHEEPEAADLGQFLEILACGRSGGRRGCAAFAAPALTGLAAAATFAAARQGRGGRRRHGGRRNHGRRPWPRASRPVWRRAWPPVRAWSVPGFPATMTRRPSRLLLMPMLFSTSNRRTPIRFREKHAQIGETPRQCPRLSAYTLLRTNARTSRRLLNATPYSQRSARVIPEANTPSSGGVQYLVPTLRVGTHDFRRSASLGVDCP